MTRMKVALTYRVLQHWRTPVFQRLAADPEIDFVALHGGDLAGTAVVNGKPLEGFRHTELPTLWPFGWIGLGERFPFPLCPTLLWHLLREKPDVILAEGGSNLFNNVSVYAYALATRTPVVWWTLGEIRSAEPRGLGQRLFRAASAAFERRATALLGYSSLALDYFQRMGYPRRIQFRAVNCVDTDRIQASLPDARERAEKLRVEMGLEGKIVLLFVGALQAGKRLEDLIDAYARLRSRHDDLRLVVVGDGSHRAALEAHTRHAGAQGVTFTGRVIENVAAYFQLGDVFVLPGLGGLAISEAMTHGLPIVCSEADGCEIDLVEPGANGAIFGVGDQEALEHTLDAMVGDRDRLRAMGERSRWIIDHRFNIATYMDNVRDALRFAHTGLRQTEVPE